MRHAGTARGVVGLTLVALISPTACAPDGSRDPEVTGPLPGPDIVVLAVPEDP